MYNENSVISFETLSFQLHMFDYISVSSVLLTQYCASDKIKKIEMDGACGTYGGGERRVRGFGRET